ncbi:MAG: pectate lyase, partial [Ignavibacteria bacterium]|nr:pectate lyase [Ignavibacteria bacterium]
MKKTIKIFICIFALLISVLIPAQNKQAKKTANYLSLNWKQVATHMPDEWYGSDEAKIVAENVLLSQKEIGGWSKNKPYHHP